MPVASRKMLWPQALSEASNEIRLYKRIIHLKTRAVGILAHGNLPIRRYSAAVTIVPQRRIHTENTVGEMAFYCGALAEVFMIGPLIVSGAYLFNGALLSRNAISA